MTRRIALAILLTVWAMLIAGGFLAYWTTRSILLADLDASLMARALTLAAQARPPTTEPAVIYLGGDRYVIRNELHQTLERPPAAPPALEPKLLSAKFSEDQRSRTVVVQYHLVPVGGGRARTLTMPYSDTAEPFYGLLRRLGWALGGFSAVAGLVAAAVAVRVSKAALEPLHHTAEQIGTIDEQALDRRIEVAALPPELHPMAERLNDMLGRLDEAFKLRNEFLAAASHELRTPVAALGVSLDVALSRPREADYYRQTLESCRTDVKQLRHLVERLMEQVRSQSLTHDEAAQEVDVAALLRECAENVAPLAAVRGVEIVRRMPERVPFRLPPGRLRSVVMNLLSNAVEYTRPQGRVELGCADRNGDGLELTVSDNGHGIAPEHLPHLFEPFYRADAARRSDAGHLGLGLSLVQAHVRAMSGECRVASEVGVGTTFTVKVPAGSAGGKRSQG